MEGKVAIVTGASSGIGEAICIKFASLGASVTLCGRDSNRLRLVFDKVVTINDGDNNRFLEVRGDINDQTVRRQIIGKTIEKFGRLDVLVLNAGVTSSRQSVFDATEVTYNAIMDTNLKSAFFLTQQAVPHLEKCKGNIICISSVFTFGIDSSRTIYSLSKVGLDNLTKHLAVDLGPKGIRVNAVNPTFIPTRIMRYLGDKLDRVNNAAADIEFSLQVLNTRPIMMEDVVEAVVFLVSNAAGLITGQQLYIDGGRRFIGPVKWSILKTKL